MRDVDVDYRALFDVHAGEGLEDAVFVFCRDGHGAYVAGKTNIFVVAHGELVGTLADVVRRHDIEEPRGARPSSAQARHSKLERRLRKAVLREDD